MANRELEPGVDPAMLARAIQVTVGGSLMAWAIEQDARVVVIKNGPATHVGARKAGAKGDMPAGTVTGAEQRPPGRSNNAIASPAKKKKKKKHRPGRHPGPASGRRRLPGVRPPATTGTSGATSSRRFSIRSVWNCSSMAPSASSRSASTMTSRVQSAASVCGRTATRSSATSSMRRLAIAILSVSASLWWRRIHASDGRVPAVLESPGGGAAPQPNPRQPRLPDSATLTGRPPQSRDSNWRVERPRAVRVPAFH